MAAGLGTRLGELTKSVPKCLVEVGGEPILGRLLRQLSAAGVTEFLINTHHLESQVREWVGSSEWRDAIQLTHEPMLLGTAGTLRRNWDFFQGSDGMVLHADNYFDFDLTELRLAFQERPRGVDMTMLTFIADDPSAFGVVELDDRRVVIGFHEKVVNPPTALASAATFAFSPMIVDAIEQLPPDSADISRDLIPLLLGRINVLKMSTQVIDIGTLESLVKARELEQF